MNTASSRSVKVRVEPSCRVEVLKLVDQVMLLVDRVVLLVDRDTRISMQILVGSRLLQAGATLAVLAYLHIRHMEALQAIDLYSFNNPPVPRAVAGAPRVDRRELAQL